MAKPLLTISYLANLSLALALANDQPFNACEVYENHLSELITIRLCDRKAPRRFPQNPGRWAYAWDESAWADGSDESFNLTIDVREWTMDQVRAFLIRAFPQRFDTEFEPLKPTASMEVIEWKPA